MILRGLNPWHKHPSQRQSWALLRDTIRNSDTFTQQEKNETSVYNDVFTTIQRTPGNAVPVMAQKSLTGKAYITLR